MQWFPINIHLKERYCLIVGGGEVAARKCALLLRAQAQITLVAPQLCDAMAKQVAAGRIKHVKGCFNDFTHLLDGAVLVVAATQDASVNQVVSSEAQARNIPVNVVDNKALSTCIMPAIIDRSPVVITMSTEGVAPVLARSIKAKIETLLPEQIGRFATLLGKVRTQLKQNIQDAVMRRNILQALSQNYLQGLIRDNTPKELQAQVDKTLTDTLANQKSTGKVSIVGAGPGDPELLTLKAHRLLQSGDVILYDHLVNAKVLEYARRDAQKIYVGKQAGKHSCTQSTIHEQMLHYANRGCHVIRLKGGDPLIFSRGSEEFKFLSEHGISFEIVPGITAALGCAASMQIPLTQRGQSRGCILITAHTCNHDEIEWDLLAKTEKTLVFYMGLKQIEMICQQLIEQGKAHDTAIALIEQGTLPEERITVGRLCDFPEKIKGYEAQSPALIIIGDVINNYPKSGS